MSSQVTIIGRLVADPEISFTQSGKALAKFRVASTRRMKNEAGVWHDAETTFWPCTAWGQLAEYMADSLAKGDQVIVHGRATSSSWETKEGERRERIEVTAENAGPNLRYTVTRQKQAGEAPASESSEIPF